VAHWHVIELAPKAAETNQPRDSRLFKKGLSIPVVLTKAIRSRMLELPFSKTLGQHVPEVKFEDFMKYLAPPMSASVDVDATMELLKLGRQPVLIASGHWKAFEKEPKEQGGEEDAVFQPIPIIFQAVVKAIIADRNSNLTANSRTIDFEQNPNMTPTSAEREDLSRPDGFMLLKSRTGDGILWADIVLSCEYKIKDGDEQLDDVRASWRS
jgi:hypothetical protein